MNWETIVVAVIVLGTAAWAARAIYRSWKKGTVCSSCADSGDCPMSKSGAISQLGPLGKPGPGLPLTELKDFDPSQTCKR